LRSSTNIIRFNVGNPDKFNIPFYFLIGANVDMNVNENLINESTAFDILNNMGGFLNFGVDGLLPIRLNSDISKMELSYQFALKSIDGLVYETGQTERFISKMFLLGFTFTSVAWNPNKPKQSGKFWIRNAISSSLNPSDKVKLLWGKTVQTLFLSHLFETGLILRDGIKIKFGFYHFLNNRNIKFIDGPSFKLSADILIN
jgi:hypothetical protein